MWLHHNSLLFCNLNKSFICVHVHSVDSDFLIKSSLVVSSSGEQEKKWVSHVSWSLKENCSKCCWLSDSTECCTINISFKGESSGDAIDIIKLSASFNFTYNETRIHLVLRLPFTSEIIKISFRLEEFSFLKLWTLKLLSQLFEKL